MEKRPSQQYYAGSAWTTNIKYPLLGETQDDATPMLLRPCSSFDHAQLYPRTLKPTLPHAHTQALPSPTLCRASMNNFPFLAAYLMSDSSDSSSSSSSSESDSSDSSSDSDASEEEEDM